MIVMLTARRVLSRLWDSDENVLVLIVIAKEMEPTRYTLVLIAQIAGERALRTVPTGE